MTQKEQKGKFGNLDDFAEPDDLEEASEFDCPEADIPTVVGKNKLVPQPIVPLDLPFAEDDFEDEVPTQVAVPVLKGEK